MVIAHPTYPIKRFSRRRDVVIMLAVIPIAAAVSSAAALYTTLYLAYTAVEPQLYTAIENLAMMASTPAAQTLQRVEQLLSPIANYIPRPPQPLVSWLSYLVSQISLWISWVMQYVDQLLSLITSHTPHQLQPLVSWLSHMASQIPLWISRISEFLGVAGKGLVWVALGILVRVAMILPAYRLGWAVLRRTARHMLYRAVRKLAEERKRAGARWDGYVDVEEIIVIGYRDAGDHIVLYTAEPQRGWINYSTTLPIHLPKKVEKWWEVVLALEAIPPIYWEECSKHLVGGGRISEAIERCRSEHGLHDRPRVRPAKISVETFTKGYVPKEIRKIHKVWDSSANTNLGKNSEGAHSYPGFESMRLGIPIRYISSPEELEELRPRDWTEYMKKIVWKGLENKWVKRWILRELKSGRILMVADYTYRVSDREEIYEARIISLPEKCIEDGYNKKEKYIAISNPLIVYMTEEYFAGTSNETWNRLRLYRADFCAIYSFKSIDEIREERESELKQSS